jgi:rhodanese-related sulfurtransferase
MAAAEAPAVVPELAEGAAPEIGVHELTKLLDAGETTLIVDLTRSLDFRDGHIPGSVWAIRSRLDAIAPALAKADHVVLTSPDGSFARLAVAEAAALTPGEVRVLSGGNAAWHAFGRPLMKDRRNPPDAACLDVYLRPYDRNDGVEEAMQAYLTWEIALAEEIVRDGTIRFGAA